MSTVSNSPTRPAAPLSMAHAGEFLFVQRVSGPQDMRRHLRELGFVEGVQIRVVSASAVNLIVLVKGARLGLDANVARHVMAA